MDYALVLTFSGILGIIVIEMISQNSKNTGPHKYRRVFSVMQSILRTYEDGQGSTKGKERDVG